MKYISNFSDAYKTLEHTLHIVTGISDNNRGIIALFIKILPPPLSSQMDSIRKFRNDFDGHGVKVAGQSPTPPKSYIELLNREINWVYNNRELVKRKMLSALNDDIRHRVNGRASFNRTENTRTLPSRRSSEVGLSQARLMFDFDGLTVDLSKVLFISLSLGDDDRWTSIYVVFLNGDCKNSVYNKTSRDCFGNSPRDYWEKNFANDGDYDHTSRMMARTDLIAAFNKLTNCCFFDGVIINAANIKNIQRKDKTVVVTTISGKEIRSVYERRSTDHKRRSVREYCDTYDLFYTENGKRYYDIPRALDKMIAFDYNMALDLLNK
ncbi:MAG: hypothetical protein IJE25_09400 [Clostridia bacterium]|nr:hypothetical protein [Clostridia bacterium]